MEQAEKEEKHRKAKEVNLTRIRFAALGSGEVLKRYEKKERRGSRQSKHVVAAHHADNWSLRPVDCINNKKRIEVKLWVTFRPINRGSKNFMTRSRCLTSSFAKYNS